LSTAVWANNGFYSTGFIVVWLVYTIFGSTSASAIFYVWHVVSAIHVKISASGDAILPRIAIDVL
jgi:uncharacterized membrane protein